MSHKELVCEDSRKCLHLNLYRYGYDCTQFGIIMIRSPFYTLTPLLRTIKHHFSIYSDRTTSNAELEQYQHYLTKHNQSLKKPHPKLQETQGTVISKLLQTQQYKPIISFLAKNTNLRLCNLKTTSNVDKVLAEKYRELSRQDQVQAAYALISFRQNRLFNLYKQNIEKKVKQSSLQSLNIEEIIVYMFGQLVLHKDIYFTSKIGGKHQGSTLQIIQQCLIHSKYRGPLIKQYTDITQYINLLLNPHLNKIEKLRTPLKKNSLLEIDVQSFLQTMGYSSKRQMTVNNFTVDFIVEKESGKHKKIALEVNGNYHYTLAGKLKGRQITRNLVVNQCIPLRIVHHQDFLLSKGHRNKQAYIESILEASEVNWECKNKGMDSGWQVINTENL